MGNRKCPLEKLVMNPQEISVNFWSGKRVLVTGHTGFKGGWLSLWLQSLGSNICGLALEPAASPNIFEEAEVASGMTSLIGDIRDLNFVQKTIIEFKPEIVFHLAAQPLVRYSYSNPIETYETNVLGTLYLLESIRLAGSAKAVVNVTTDKCYENPQGSAPHSEGDVLGGYDPYSNSKSCSELITSAYKNSFFQNENIGIASARAGNVIGGGDWSKDRLVPDLLRAFEVGEVAMIRNPEYIRPWQHVLEPLSGYLMLAQKLFEAGRGWSEPWNFGPNTVDSKAVGWIAGRMSEIWGGMAQWEHQSSLDNMHESESLMLDISKSKRLLQWEPKWGLDLALNKTIEWHLAWINGECMKQFTQQQIDEYNKS